MENCYFNNITSNGPGTLIFAKNIQENSIIMKNNLISNVYSTNSLIHAENCNNISIIGNKFIKNVGTVFFLLNSYLETKSNLVIHQYCNSEEGCFCSLEEHSTILSFENRISNISNQLKGGVYSIKKSALLIGKDHLMDLKSNVFGGCLYASNSNITISNFFAFNFENGCIYAEASSLEINSTKFYSNITKPPTSSLCYSIICAINLVKLSIDSVIFYGNKNNTYFGSVHFIFT